MADAAIGDSCATRAAGDTPLAVNFVLSKIGRYAGAAYMRGFQRLIEDARCSYGLRAIIAMGAEAVGTGTPRLLLSFWDICLENLPFGRFERRRVPIDTARGLIHAARAEDRLLCVTSKDLLAPYGVKHLRRYRELCGLLASDFSIAVGVEDFMSLDTEPPALRCINPLQCVQLATGDQMLVATCHYVMKFEHVDIDRRLSVAPDSLQFDLIDAA